MKYRCFKWRKCSSPLCSHRVPHGYNRAKTKCNVQCLSNGECRPIKAVSRKPAHNTASLKLPTASEFVNMVQSTVPEPLTKRERGLLGNGYLILYRQLQA